MIGGARVGGRRGFVLAIPQMIGAFIGGYLYSLNPEYPFYLLSAALTICLILAITIIREPEKPEY